MADSLRLDALAWLHRPRDDLGAAAKLLSGTDPYPTTAAYHCQQAAEKALKAVIAGTGDAVPKTHDLRVLLGRCVTIDRSLDQFYDACDELTPYSTGFRYPSENPDPSPDQIRCALTLSEGIVAAVVLRTKDTG